MTAENQVTIRKELFNIEAEQAVLGTIILNNEYLNRVSEFLREELDLRFELREAHGDGLAVKFAEIGVRAEVVMSEVTLDVRGRGVRGVGDDVEIHPRAVLCEVVELFVVGADRGTVLVARIEQQ